MDLVADGDETRPSGVTASSTWRVLVSSRGSPCRLAVRMSPGWTRWAGCVPAEVAGRELKRRQASATSCERAEFWLHTKTT